MNKFFKKSITFVSTIGVVCASSMMVFATEGATTTPDAGTKSAGWMSYVLPVVWIAVLLVGGYFLVIRPNKKRKEQEEKLRSSLMLGDQIVTIGGICGTIVNIKDDTITIETSLDRTLIEFKNWAIREVKKLETDDEPAK